MAAPHIDPESDAPELAAAKRSMRNALRKRRRSPDPRENQSLNEAVLAALGPVPGLAVASFWPLPGEPDLRPAMGVLARHGCQVLLPETTPKGQALIFRRWRPGAVLRPGRFGTFHPEGEMAVPDIVLVPLLGFDRRLHRLGYGGGYYDRTLAALPQARAIGVALAMQAVDSVPVGPHDVPLHGLVTEAGLVSAERR